MRKKSQIQKLQTQFYYNYQYLKAIILLYYDNEKRERKQKHKSTQKKGILVHFLFSVNFLFSFRNIFSYNVWYL
jgi:hypothetical protein